MAEPLWYTPIMTGGPLQVFPIGGLGEIGMNCLLVGEGDRWVMVDCGIQFPAPWELGAERRLPDLEFLRTFRGRIEAIVITHGHEDHIGALPWVLPELGDVPVFASSFTRELIRHRLGEHGMWSEDLITLHHIGERFTAGPFEVESVRVTHSLPDCASLVLRGQGGTLLHTGDWKIDEEPVDGEHFDRERFAQLGDEGVTLLLSDSTNVRAPGRTRSETTVAHGLADVIEAADGRVICAMFASNLHRIRSLAAVAESTGRKLVFSGTSLWRYLEAAERVGRAPISPRDVVDVNRLGDLAPHEALVAVTGSQGERQATLWRAAIGQHRHLRIDSGDLIIHSARVIPGNEAQCYGMFNQLSQRGAELLYGRGLPIHASGHARADELREMIELVRPQHFAPLHGEHTFLKAHARLALDAGVPGVSLLVNGSRLDVEAAASGSGARVVAAEPRAMTMNYNDGPVTGTAEEMALKERLKLAWNGVISASVCIVDQPDRTRVARSVSLEMRALFKAGEPYREALEAAATRAVAACPPGTPLSEVRESVRGSLRSCARRQLGKRPEVLVFFYRGEPA